METRRSKRLVAALFLLTSCPIAVRQTQYETIINNGSSDNRVDIAVLGDGYTAG